MKRLSFGNASLANIKLSAPPAEQKCPFILVTASWDPRPFLTATIKYANDATSLYKDNINAKLNYGSLSKASKKYAECSEMLIKVDVPEFGQTTCWSLKE